MSVTVVSLITDTGYERIAKSMAYGKAFVIDRFSVGDGGHDPLDPSIILTPDTTVLTCPSQVFGPVDIQASSIINRFSPQFTCILNANEAVGPLSNICLHGTVVYSPIVGDPDVGQSFLFSIGNFPRRVKINLEALTFKVLVRQNA